MHGHMMPTPDLGAWPIQPRNNNDFIYTTEMIRELRSLGVCACTRMCVLMCMLRYIKLYEVKGYCLLLSNSGSMCGEPHTVCTCVHASMCHTEVMCIGADLYFGTVGATNVVQVSLTKDERG